MKELKYNVELREGAEVASQLKVVHPPKKGEEAAGGGGADGDVNTKKYKDILAASESDKSSR